MIKSFAAIPIAAMTTRGAQSLFLPLQLEAVRAGRFSLLEHGPLRFDVVIVHEGDGGLVHVVILLAVEVLASLAGENELLVIIASLGGHVGLVWQDAKVGHRQLFPL